MNIQCLSYNLQGDIAHSEVQDSLMCSAGRTSFSLYDLVQWKLSFAALICNDASFLIFDAVQCRIIDRSCIAPRTSYIAPASGYTMSEFT